METEQNGSVVLAACFPAVAMILRLRLPSGQASSVQAKGKDKCLLIQ